MFQSLSVWNKLNRRGRVFIANRYSFPGKATLPRISGHGQLVPGPGGVLLRESQLYLFKQTLIKQLCLEVTEPP